MLYIWNNLLFRWLALALTRWWRWLCLLGIDSTDTGPCWRTEILVCTSPRTETNDDPLPTVSMCIVFVFYVFEKPCHVRRCWCCYCKLRCFMLIFSWDQDDDDDDDYSLWDCCSGFTDYIPLSQTEEPRVRYNNSLYYANEFVCCVKFKQSKGFAPASALSWSGGGGVGDEGRNRKQNMIHQTSVSQF